MVRNDDNTSPNTLQMEMLNFFDSYTAVLNSDYKSYCEYYFVRCE